MTESELLSAYNKVLAENVELKKELDWYKNYADRLVEHKDMVCLPADLKNLREREEKDKQIEYLLQKVKELSDPDEDLDEYED